MFKILLLGLLVSTSLAPAEPTGFIKVLVVDTGISPHKDLTNVQYAQNKDYVDNHGHGTHVAGLIQLGKDLNDPLCAEVKIYSCKYYDRKNADLYGIAKCLTRATAQGFNYVNVSGGGPVPMSQEFTAFKHYKGIVFAATGNSGLALDENYQYYPASYSHTKRTYIEDTEFKRVTPLGNIKMVQGMCSGKLCAYSNHHPSAIQGYGDYVTSTLPNDKYGSLRGTSQATAIALHDELQQKCRQLHGAKNVNP